MCRCRAAGNLLRRLQCGERNWCTAWPPAAPLRGRLGYELHVCRCALGNKPEGVTEQQVGICVYDRPPGYNPNEDNIVRSQARLLSGVHSATTAEQLVLSNGADGSMAFCYRIARAIT